MKRKIFSYMCLIAIITLLLSTAALGIIMHDGFEEQVKNGLKIEAEYIKKIIKGSENQTFENINPETRITLIDFQGNVLYDNKIHENGEIENHLNRPEIKAALENGFGEAQRISDSLSEKTYYYALNLNDNRILRLSRTEASIYSSLTALIPYILLIAFIISVIAILLAKFMTNGIVKPINNLNLENPSENHCYDELTPLLTKINKQKSIIRLQINELRRKQSEFTAITENMCEGFIIIDKNTEILSYNKSALKLLGAEAPAERDSVLTLNRSENFNRAIEAALDGKNNEKLLRSGECCYQIIANPVLYDKNIAGAVIIILDVTEKEQREKLRREFTANVSHELKTPLTSISGFAEIIKAGIAKPEDVPRFAENIYSEAQRLITLVGDIINLAQIDENTTALKKEPVDLYKCAKSVINQLSDSASKNNILLSLKGDSAVIDGVPQILEEIIFNLCDNAIKYNRPNGSVTVSVENDKSQIALTVSDTGIGIPADELNRVFERFYRVDKSHSKEIGGTGLGLSIVKHGVMLHEASLSIESRLDKGTKIKIVWGK